ncbi:hypothetical protein JOC77_001857 [Peribacillus deserti]|uniref:NERD domain-containing protein n=1 Tax=Peribacillus deserti TaxID=673318 RepID=A0ABS2QH51_9BACI|nr:nuclease-related domain-containing protein [Peribacillus deserti]MBM7692427.1 hypothetical protein [Peribacillus deserti]
MIVKNRTVPAVILKMEALLRRLNKQHPKRKEIESDLSKRLAGYKGEQSLDYYLNQLPYEDFIIFHDLRLFAAGCHFQIDTLIISPFFILTIEVKNMSGTLYFDKDYNQLIRTHNDKEEGFPDPILQSERHRLLLVSWLQLKGFSTLPVENLVIVSNPSTIIKSSPDYVISLERVCHAARLLKRIHEFKEFYNKKMCSPYRLNRLTHLLLKDHIPLMSDVLSRYKLSEDEVIKGVLCPACHFVMERKQRSWHCKSCKLPSKYAHLKALEDYFMLLDSSITNVKFRKFLNIESRHTASNLLSSLKLPSTGKNKGTIYHQALASNEPTFTNLRPGYPAQRQLGTSMSAGSTKP